MDIQNKSDLINYIIKQHDYRSYLEIGVQRGANYKEIETEIKACVDPDSLFPATYKMSSDAYFEYVKKGLPNDIVPNCHYDVVFIDGMHLQEYALRDIKNTIKYLSPYYIVVHDCNPSTKAMQERERPPLPRPWTGDVWKSWVLLRCSLNDVFMFVVDIDYGCGIISKGKQKPFVFTNKLSYEALEDNRIELLNLKSVKYFMDFVRRKNGTS